MDWFGLFLHLNGRIGRRSFWIGIVVVGAALLAADVATRSAPATLNLLAWGVLAYPLSAVVAKRLHDLGRSGLWALLLLAPLGGALIAGAGARLLGLGETAILGAAKTGFGAAALALIVAGAGYLGARPGGARYTRHGPPPIG